MMLQFQFLAFWVWDPERVNQPLQQRVMDEHGGETAIGVIDASAHPKQGDQTAIGVIDASAHPKQGDQMPGVQRQYGGESGKLENCVGGQHLLYTNQHPKNPFGCVLASDWYLPEKWAADRERGRAAGIPDDLGYRPKWRIAIDPLESAIGQGVRWAWVTFDEDYGKVPAFWFELDRLGQRAMGEVPVNFYGWPTWPHCRSPQAAHPAESIRDRGRSSQQRT